MKSSGEDGASVTVVAGVVGLDADIVEFGVEKPFPEPHGACPHTHSETYGAAGLVDDVLVIARAHTEAKMQEAVGRYVKGTGAAAERLHGVVEARIRTDPASPDTVVMNAHQLVVGPMLNHTIVMDMQSFATGQQTQFDLDRHRQFPARLAGIGEVSEDPAVARDQLPRSTPSHATRPTSR